jgi:hypothetical protein
VLAYGLALEDHGRDEVLRGVGVEPSGEAFNSIAFDEPNRRPFNPMVNAGALVTTDLVRVKDPEEKLERILAKRLWAANPSLEVDRDVFERELRTADRNRAIAYLMRSQGLIGGDAEATLALYLQQCSIKVTCRDRRTGQERSQRRDSGRHPRQACNRGVLYPGSISSATASVAFGSARRCPSDSGCTSSPPKPKMSCSGSGRGLDRSARNEV